MEIAVGMAILSIFVAVGTQFARSYFSQSRRVQNRQDILRMRKELRSAINCSKTLAVNGITPATVTTNCLSTSQPGGQVGPWLDLMRCVNRANNPACEDVVSYLPAAKQGDGTIPYGDYTLKVSCSEAEEGLVITASRLGGDAMEQDQILFGVTNNASPLCFLDYVSPKAVTALDGSLLSACGIAGGKAYCWGNNSFGHLGNGNNASQMIPVAVSGLSSGVTGISSDEAGGSAIVNGAVWAWGGNSYGSLGIGTISNTYLAQVPEITLLTNGVTQISGGNFFRCAIQNGAAKCWGRNDHGQLGDGTTTDNGTPQQVIGLNTDVTYISVGVAHACAIHSGIVKCWGWNNKGQLGNGTIIDSSVPVNVNALGVGAKTLVSAGGEFSCAVVNGRARCWGRGDLFQLGNNSPFDSLVPVNVTGAAANVTALKSHVEHTCVIMSGGLKCWGRVASVPFNWFTATDIPGFTSSISVIGVGGNQIFAVQGGIPSSMGANGYAQLGNGTTGSQTVMTAMAFP